MKTWKAILGVVLVFLLGAVAGGLVVGARAAKRLHRVLHGGTAFTAQEIVRPLAWHLGLDASQREQVLKIVEVSQAKIVDARKQCQPQIHAAVDESIAETRAVLRPDQAEKFDKMVAERRAKWSQPNQ